MNIALVGNQNSGKTTLYNALSGGRRRVGNFPGVTVDAETRRAKGMEDVYLTDLPGTYSLTPGSGEEEITAEYLAKNRPDGIINVVDATCPARGLYLTAELTELGIPTVLVFNMTDELERRGGSIDYGGMEGAFGIPAVGISASRGRGTAEALALAVSTVTEKSVPCKRRRAGGVEERYRFVDSVCNSFFIPPRARGRTADDITMGKYTAYPVFFAVVAAVFYLTFNVIGGGLSRFFDLCMRELSEYLSSFMTGAGVHPVMVSLAVDGALSGVGAVLSFLPTVLTLFFFLSVLEDTGYMARVAFIMDAPFRALGLSGKSAVPLLLGFGCSVPAIMASRTLPTARDRALTAALVPFMSCGAKIPIYALFASAFFPGRSALVMGALYALGIVCAIISALIIKRVSPPPPGTEAEYILELPPWRLPTVKGVCRIMSRKAGELLSRVFGVVFLTSILVWASSTFDLSLSVTHDEDASILAAVGRIIAPLFAPLGFGDWRAASALAAGLSAKEAVIGTLAVLTKGELGAVFSQASAVSFLTFTLLYTPCSAAVSAMRGELGGMKKTLPVLALGFALAYGASFAAYSLFCLWI